MKTILNDNRAFFVVKYGEEEILMMENYLASIPEDFLTFKQFSLGIEGASITNEDIDNALLGRGCFFGPGSSLGCCGNYSGCCVLKSPVCTAHDMICWNCDHWYCGWACVPG